MKPRKWQRILKTEKFALHKAVGEQWTFSVRWKRTPKNYGERVFQAPSIDEAITMAPVLSGYEAAPRDQLLSLEDAFKQSSATAKRGDKATADWNYWQKRFALWLVAHHPNIGNWNQLTRPIVRQYLDSYAGKAANTRRLALQPLVQTDAYVAREYKFPRIADDLGIGSQTKRTPAVVYLTDVFELCQTHLTDEPELRAGAALQGLAGLRLQEAHNLTWDKVDFDRGLIEISGDVKNAWSARVIPLPAYVLDILKALDQHRRAKKVKTVKNPERLLERFATWDGYSKALQALLDERKPGWDIRRSELRNALPTWSNAQGIHNDIWEQYLGHAPATVTARHYIPRLGHATLGEEEALLEQMKPFRNLVVAPLNVEIADLPRRLKEKSEAEARKSQFPPISTQEARPSDAAI